MDVFNVLGEPTRRLILELLSQGERSVNDIAAALRTRGPISQPAVSQHLKVLLSADLVTVRSEGTRRIYALEVAGLQPARAWLARLVDPLATFAQPLDALETEIARGKRSGAKPHEARDRGSAAG